MDAVDEEHARWSSLSATLARSASEGPVTPRAPSQRRHARQICRGRLAPARWTPAALTRARSASKGFDHRLPAPTTQIPGQDSNLDEQDQNLLCYRYTTGECTQTYVNPVTAFARRISPPPPIRQRS